MKNSILSRLWPTTIAALFVFAAPPVRAAETPAATKPEQASLVKQLMAQWKQGWQGAKLQNVR